jgi:hypothetical protein
LEIKELLHSDVNCRHPDVAQLLSNLALLLRVKGLQHFAEAELLSDVNGRHPDVAWLLNGLAGLLLELQSFYFSDAESLFARAVCYYIGLWRDSGVLHPQLRDVCIGLFNSFYEQKVDKSL